MVYETYNMVNKDVSEIILVDVLTSKVAYLGGITLKMENSDDMFLPLMFGVKNGDEKYKDLLHVFGNLTMDPLGCINLMYLKE